VADQLWSCIDKKLWQHTHNPWMIMQTVSMKRLNELVEDEHFNQLLKQLHEEQKFALNRETWFNHIHSGGDLNLVAYFCMEYGLSEALPRFQADLVCLQVIILKPVMIWVSHWLPSAYCINRVTFVRQLTIRENSWSFILLMILVMPVTPIRFTGQ